MRVEEIMTQEVRSIGPDLSAAEAARIMWDGDCGAVPVVDGAGRPIGIVTDRDLCMASYTRGTTLHGMSVRSVMSPALHTVQVGATIWDAESTMAWAKVRRLPVVDSTRVLVGIVTLSDVARARSTPGLDVETVRLIPDVATTLASIASRGPAAPMS